jgi:HK97 family phage portal protein
MSLFSKIIGKDELNNRIRELEQKVSQSAHLIHQFLGANGAVWPERNYENFAREAYIKNVINFRCVKEISQSVCSVSWKLFEGDDKNKTEVNTHPIIDLLKRPNPEDSFSFLISKAISYLPLSGNTYIESVGPSTGPNKGVPQELWVLRPDRMKVLVEKSTGMIKGYQYEIGGRKTQWDVDLITGKSPILHLKKFHPLNDTYGLADVEPTARDIDISNSASSWKKNMMDNEGRPGMVFGVDKDIGDQQFDKLVKYLNEKHSGAANAGKNLLVTGLNKAYPYAFKPKEMDFLKSDIEVSRKIAIGMGVPPMIIGIPGESTFANFSEAVLFFWETTIWFYLRFIKGELNNWFFGADNENLFLDFMLDDIPALAPRREKMWKRAQESDFLQINEKREMVGKEAVDGGDVVLIDSNKIPLNEAGIEETTEEEAKKQLALLGNSEEEINELIGLPKDGQTADKSCGHNFDYNNIDLKKKDIFKKHGHKKSKPGTIEWHFHFEGMVNEQGEHDHGGILAYVHCKGGKKNPYEIKHTSNGNLKHEITKQYARGHGFNLEPQWFKFVKKLGKGWDLSSGEKIKVENVPKTFKEQHLSLSS